MKRELICTKPHTNEFHKICDCYPEKKCCMCPTPSIAINIQDIDKMKELLQTDGCNSKKQVLKILRHYL